ncbi:M17 family metallopeptidase [uncultured Robinsoniella sp.]|uniref:M17 family metallopeptidase n=1 Tax=uncultured Robinsoniella sp. TaxID=904190 RepID=UPI00374F89EA
MKFFIKPEIESLEAEDRLILLGKYGEEQNLPFICSSIEKRQISRWDIQEQGEYPFCDLQKQCRWLGKHAAGSIYFYLDGLCKDKENAEKLISIMVKAIVKGGYSFAKEGLKKIENNSIFINRELFSSYPGSQYTFITKFDLREILKEAEMNARCIGHARSLGNLPGNYFGIREMESYVRELADYYQVTAEVYDDRALRKMGCQGILSVNQGSSKGARLLVLHYNGNESGGITALVGKAVMFDSGGYHLKSMKDMEGMQYDMCGGANILSAFEIAVQRKSRQRICVIIPCVENVISPDACKMGDVIKTMSGKTVEIYNTDAEGRLILCDALTYAAKIGADHIIDLATLTYSCQNALGSEIAGIFSNSDEFCGEFSKVAKNCGEKLWRLPLDRCFHERIKESLTADYINYAPHTGGGASIAASFLEEFIEEGIRWIHLDVVGPAVNKQETDDLCKGATGVFADTIAALLKGKGEKDDGLLL